MRNVSLQQSLALLVASGIVIALAACGGDDEGDGAGGSAGGGVSGSVRIDGSSTVGPLSEVIAEGFSDANPDAKVTVGTSGTGGGFERFCAGETDINDASRAVKEEEVELCGDGGVKYEEITVATDALTIVVHADNPVDCLTIPQLNQIWDRDSEVENWSEIEGLEVDFDERLDLFGPGTDSGTFDYFSDVVNGGEGVHRVHYNNAGEDDSATVLGVRGTLGGMGYFGFSFFDENREDLKALEVENPETGECVAPSIETAQSGDYAPLSRPLFVYPSAAALERPEVNAFLEFYLANLDEAAGQAGFIALTEEQLAESQEALDRIVGADQQGSA
ncbi:MAG: phosphate ABC transporter substrate-binding protein PstS family protein [Solirubrobacterales bacterium]